MLVEFEGFDEQFPCRLAAVIGNDEFVSNVGGSSPYKLVVQSTIERSQTRTSALLSEWSWSPDYHVIDTNDVIAPCFVISIADDHSVVLETKAQHLWAAEFTNII
jgi:hypothetical protein